MRRTPIVAGRLEGFLIFIALLFISQRGATLNWLDSTKFVSQKDWEFLADVFWNLNQSLTFLKGRSVPATCSEQSILPKLYTRYIDMYSTTWRTPRESYGQRHSQKMGILKLQAFVSGLEITCFKTLIRQGHSKANKPFSPYMSRSDTILELNWSAPPLSLYLKANTFSRIYFHISHHLTGI